MNKLFRAVIGVSALSVGIANAQLPISDDFSTWDASLPSGNYQTFNHGSVVNGWTITGTSVDVVHTPWSNTPSTSPFWLDLAGTPGPGGIEQIAGNFVVGQTYTMTFDAFSNDGYATKHGHDIFAELGGAHLAILTSSLNASTYTPESLTWTATSTSGRVAFYTPDPSTGNTGIANVTVQAVPEPCSMLALCGALVGLIRRRNAR